MKNREFKKEVEKLAHFIQENDYPEVVRKLVLSLDNLLKPLDDEGEVTPELMAKVCPIVDEFWHWVRQTLPCKKWQEGAEVKPWLTVQEKLAKAGLIAANYHHPQLYKQLAEQCDRLGDGQLALTKLISLLKPCGRLIGYAELSELGNYPLDRVNASIAHSEKLKLRHEIGKQKNKITLIAAIYYLIHHHCTVAQINLLHPLIYFRLSTTDEERRSEQAIINCLFNQSVNWQILFANKAVYIDVRERGINDCLKEISHLLPKSNHGFINALNEKRWIYAFIRQCRKSHLLEEGDLITYTMQLFQTDFLTLKDSSYMAALDFSALVRRKTPSLTAKELGIVHCALYVFCLSEYERDRKVDPRPDSYYLFSGATKCNAAVKKQQFLMGLNPKFGFFEAMALKQGRLNSLINLFEGSAPFAGSKAALPPAEIEMKSI